jgi:hypothetical protein
LWSIFFYPKFHYLKKDFINAIENTNIDKGHNKKHAILCSVFQSFLRGVIFGWSLDKRNSIKILKIIP